MLQYGAQYAQWSQPFSAHNTKLDFNGLVSRGSNGLVSLGSNGLVSLGSNSLVSLGSNGLVSLGSNSLVSLGSNGSNSLVSLGSNGSNSLVSLGSNGLVSLGSNGLVSLGSKSLVSLGSNGSVSLDSNRFSLSSFLYINNPSDQTWSTPQNIAEDSYQVTNLCLGIVNYWQINWFWHVINNQVVISRQILYFQTVALACYSLDIVKNWQPTHIFRQFNMGIWDQ